jgi:hypothetical protein
MNVCLKPRPGFLMISRVFQNELSTFSKFAFNVPVHSLFVMKKESYNAFPL